MKLVVALALLSNAAAFLAPVTPRALSTTLKAVIDEALVRRKLEDRYPPLPLYALTGKGQELAAALGGSR